MPDLGLLQRGVEDANTVQYIPHAVRCAGALSLTCGISSARSTAYRLSNDRFHRIIVHGRCDAIVYYVLVLKVTE